MSGARSYEAEASQAVVDLLRQAGPLKYAEICFELENEPGYWDEWPLLWKVLHQLKTLGVVQRHGYRSHHWSLTPSATSAPPPPGRLSL